jgi:hypothetical protein
MDLLPDEVFHHITRFVEHPRDFVRLRAVSTSFCVSLEPFFRVSPDRFLNYLGLLRDSEYLSVVRIETNGHFQTNLVASIAASLMHHANYSESDGTCSNLCQNLWVCLEDYLLDYSLHEIREQTDHEIRLSVLRLACRMRSRRTVLHMLRTSAEIDSLALLSCISSAVRGDSVEESGEIVQMLLEYNHQRRLEQGHVREFWSTTPSEVLKRMFACGLPLDFVPVDFLFLSPALSIERGVLEFLVTLKPLRDKLSTDPRFALHFSRVGDLESLKLVLSVGALIEPLNCILHSENIELIRFLAKRFRIDLNTRYNSECLIKSAAASGDAAFLRAVLRLGVEVTGSNGIDALLEGINNCKITNLLLKNGADINQPLNFKKETLLHISIRREPIDLDYLKFLIKNGANVNALDIYGNSPLMLSVAAGNIEVTKLLIAKGAIRDLVNHEGETAVLLAEALNRNDHIEMLSPDSRSCRPRKSRRILS